MTNTLCLQFSGNYDDPVTGGYPLGNGYRTYLPGIMRFTAPDSESPFGSGGVNSYYYCQGDPINHSDPSGHMAPEPLEEENEFFTPPTLRRLSINSTTESSVEALRPRTSTRSTSSENLILEQTNEAQADTDSDLPTRADMNYLLNWMGRYEIGRTFAPRLQRQLQLGEAFIRSSEAAPLPDYDTVKEQPIIFPKTGFLFINDHFDHSHPTPPPYIDWRRTRPYEFISSGPTPPYEFVGWDSMVARTLVNNDLPGIEDLFEHSDRLASHLAENTLPPWTPMKPWKRFLRWIPHRGS